MYGWRLSDKHHLIPKAVSSGLWDNCIWIYCYSWTILMLKTKPAVVSLPSLANDLMLPRCLIIVAMHFFKGCEDACMKGSMGNSGIMCTCSLNIHAVQEVATAVCWVISLVPPLLVTNCFIDLICLILSMRCSRGHTWICPFQIRYWSAEKFKRATRVTKLTVLLQRNSAQVRDSPAEPLTPGQSPSSCARLQLLGNTTLLGFKQKKKLLNVIQRILRVMHFCDTS